MLRLLMLLSYFYCIRCWGDVIKVSRLTAYYHVYSAHAQSNTQYSIDIFPSVCADRTK